MKRLLVASALAAVTAFVAAMAIIPGAASAAPGCPKQWVSPPYPDPSVRVPAVGTMTIGGIGLNTPIFQGQLPDIESEASVALQHGPAFYPPGMVWNNGRANHLPGNGGTVAMLGHRTTRTHPFCLVNQIRLGSYAVIRMKYGTFVYRAVAKMSLLADNWSAFEWPSRYDPDSKTWNKGLKPEYLVIGACDPPHSAVRRMNVIFKLVSERRA